MGRNKKLLLLICLLFILNVFNFDVQALSSKSSSQAIGNVNIVSSTDTSLETVEAWARSKNATETFVGLAKIYKKYAESRGGVNWVLAYVQAAKETGYGKFGGVLDESYHNPCGLKNPSGGYDYDADAHKKFDNWEQGVLAHLDHLALYAAANGFPKTTYVDKWKDEELASDETYDPRHIGWFGTTNGILGKARDVLSLTGSWASDPNYGIELFRMYCDATNSEYLPAKSNLESPSNSEVINNGKLRVKGWALHAFGIKEIKVLVDNSQVATINTGISRLDVNSTYPGYFNGTNSGFDETIDISNLGSGNKTVEVIIVARNGETQSYKRNIVVKGENVSLPKINSLDAPTNNSVVTDGNLQIRGWALDEAGVKEVRVYIDNKDFGTITYGTTRTDVNKAYPGYSSGNNAGFDGKIDVSSLTSGNKNVVVKITSNDGTSKDIERTITIQKLQSRSSLDEPTNNSIAGSTTLKVRGWALDSSGIKEVRVYVDGKDLGTVTYGTKRTDVNKAYPGYSSGDNSGFEGIVDISSVAAGDKKLTVKITANDGTTQTIDRTIKVEKLLSRSSLDEPTSNTTVASGQLKVRGWALADSGIKEVRVYVDNIDLGTITYGTTRTDVNKAYPGYSSGDNAGFEGIINLGGMTTGDKKLTVKITANDGTTQIVERDIVYRQAKLVVVDPGHEIESIDPGAVATHNGIRYVEANLNLQIAIKLKAELEAKGIQVYMTRYDGIVIDNDSTESLKKRVKIANEMNADLFVSIHHNSFTSSSANGFEVYYSTGTPITTYISERMITEDGRDLTLEMSSYTSRSTTDKVSISKALATAITNEASSTLGLYNRGAKDSNLYVCKNTTMPSILIENGFLTNPTEAAKVSTTGHQQKLAEITAKRINEVLK